MKKYPKQSWIHVIQEDIDAGKTCDPNNCMIKLAVARALNIPHGYIKVDATGISITRRTDWREKSFLVREAIKNMLMFDDFSTRKKVRPFKFKATWIKTTKVYRSTPERREQINNARKVRKATNKANGIKEKKYNLHERVHGLSMPKAEAA